MEDKKINRLLQTVGKRAFIDYYEEFEKGDVFKKQLIDKIYIENGDKDISVTTPRVSTAYRLMKDGIKERALYNVIKLILRTTKTPINPL